MVSQALKESASYKHAIGYGAVYKYLTDNFDVSTQARTAFYIKRELKSGLESGAYKAPPHHPRSYYVPAERSGTAKKRSASASPKKRTASPKTAKKAAASPEKKRKTKASTKETGSTSPKKPAQKRTKKAASTEGQSADANSVSIAGSKYSHYWQYKADNQNWGNYDLEASDVLEGVYQGYLANRGDTDVRSVKSGQWEYQVDFQALKQTNLQHESHTTREIRRVPNTHGEA